MHAAGSAGKALLASRTATTPAQARLSPHACRSSRRAVPARICPGVGQVAMRAIQTLQAVLLSGLQGRGERHGMPLNK
jgi:hypothetical protein